MGWIRHRQNFNTGPGDCISPCQWEYTFASFAWDRYEISAFADELKRKYDWTGVYRGCEIESVEDMEVPYKEMRRRIGEAEREIENETAVRAAMFEQLSAQQIATFDRN